MDVYKVFAVEHCIKNLSIIPTAAFDSKCLFFMKTATVSGAKKIQQLLISILDTNCKCLEIVHFHEKVIIKN